MRSTATRPLRYCQTTRWGIRSIISRSRFRPSLVRCGREESPRAQSSCVGDGGRGPSEGQIPPNSPGTVPHLPRGRALESGRLSSSHGPRPCATQLQRSSVQGAVCIISARCISPGNDVHYPERCPHSQRCMNTRQLIAPSDSAKHPEASSSRLQDPDQRFQLRRRIPARLRA
jgi:hypothetical protein